MTCDIHLLDANIISKILYPKHPSNIECGEWFIRFLNDDKKKIYLPEIAVYEVRRGLCVKKLKDSNFKGLEKFDEFSKLLPYLPINTNVFKIAEELWARARVNGYPTATNDSLDADVLIAAQAIDIKASVITENIKHLKNYVTTHHWRDLC